MDQHVVLVLGLAGLMVPLAMVAMMAMLATRPNAAGRDINSPTALDLKAR